MIGAAALFWPCIWSSIPPIPPGPIIYLKGTARLPPDVHDHEDKKNSSLYVSARVDGWNHGPDLQNPARLMHLGGGETSFSGLVLANQPTCKQTSSRCTVTFWLTRGNTTVGGTKAKETDYYSNNGGPIVHNVWNLTFPPSPLTQAPVVPTPARLGGARDRLQHPLV